MEENNEKQFVVGIDVGGQTSKLGVVDARGTVLAQTVIRTDVYGDDADAFLDALAKAVKAVIKEAARKAKSAEWVSEPPTETIIPARSPMHRTLPGLPRNP